MENTEQITQEEWDELKHDKLVEEAEQRDQDDE